MRIKTLALMALLCLSCAARAEAYTGVTTAVVEIPVCAEADGVLARVFAETGAVVDAGDILAEYRTEKVFAAQDGTVAAIHAREGDRVSGTALEIMPMEKYRIYCTARNAYPSPECMLIHNGERVYIQCTINATHRGIGVATGVDGTEYSVLTIGGEFQVGETVYLYRDADCSIKQRLGIGTVVENDTEKYTAEGAIMRMYVQKGDEVERGQLLYETLSIPDPVVRADIPGIVTDIRASVGETVSSGQAIAFVAPKESILVEISADERAAAEFPIGARASLTYAADRSETVYTGTVVDISDTDATGTCRIRIAPDETDALSLGMTVNVTAKAPDSENME